MRPSKPPLLPALVIVLLVLQLVAPASALDQQIPHRIIEVNENGLVYIYDVLPAIGGTIRVGFPKDFVKNLVNYACKEARELKLVIEDDFFWIVIDGVSSREIHLLTIFRDIISWNSVARTYSLRIPAYPRVESLGKTDFSVEVRLPTDVSIIEISPALLNQIMPGVLSGTLHNLDLSGESISMISINFSSESLRLLDVISAKLLVEVPEGRVSISMRMKLIGGSQLNEVKMKLPEGFKLIGAEDALGKLSSRVENGEVVVGLRQPLTEGKSDFFTVIAKVDDDSDFIRLEDEKISIRLFMPLNTTIWTYEMEMRLRGWELRSWSLEPIKLKREYPEKTILIYRFNRVDPLNAGEFRVDVSFERRMSLFQIAPYLVLASLILLISSITIVYRSRREVVEKKLGERFSDEVGLITGIYQRLMGLISSDKIYDRGLARRSLLDMRAEVKRWIESIRNLGDDLIREESKATEQVKDLIRTADEFQHAVERTWNRIYPYFSKSLPKSKLNEILEECRVELKRAYESIIDRLEGLRRKLS